MFQLTIAIALTLVIAVPWHSTSTSHSCPPFHNVPQNLNATAWVACPNQTDPSGAGVWSFPGFQCRTVYYPASYLTNRTTPVQANLERRFVKGTPKSIVVLVGGEPGQGSDLLALSTALQIENALLTDYVVYVPSIRGATNTTSVASFESIPLNLYDLIKNTNYEDYSVTNAAMDLISSMMDAKAEFKAATLNALGFSFGSYIVQRVMTLKPNLLSSAILDSPPSAINGSNFFANQVSYSPQLSTNLIANCKRDQFCASKSWTSPQLVSFLNSVRNTTNPCLDQVVKLVGAPNSTERSQLISTIMWTLAQTPNVAIPKALLGANPNSTQYLYQIEQSYVMKSNGSVYIDFRSIALAFINQVAQCKPTTMANFTAAIQPIVKVVSIVEAVENKIASYNRTVGINAVTGLLMLLSEGYVPRVNQSKLIIAASGSFVRPPPSLFVSQDLLESQLANFTKMTDCYSNKAPKGVTTRVVLLASKLDATVPFGESFKARTQLGVNSPKGGKKTLFAYANAGHEIITRGYSLCSGYLIKGVILQNTPTIAQYISCLKMENAMTVDWQLAALPQALNSSASMWSGLTATTVAPTPTRKPTLQPSRSPVPPTRLPTMQPTIKVTSTPTTAQPSIAPTTHKQFCRTFVAPVPCAKAHCTWYPSRNTCAP